MNIYVLNRSFERVAVVDDYISIIWTTRYYTYGDFELYINADEGDINTLQAGNYLVREQDISGDEYRNVMIISNIELSTDAEDGDKLIITGYCLKSILLRRVVATQTVLSGAVQSCVATLINGTIINPSVSARRISNFVHGTNDLINNYTMEMQITGDVLEKAVSEICQTYGYGYDVFIRGSNFVFYLYEGTDRSFNQDVNPYVIFSGDFDNLLSSDYKINRDDYSNVAYVAGEGEGTDRTIVMVGNSAGLERYEQWVDARNASSNNGEISVADYKKMLVQEGTEKLSETAVTTSFEGEIENTVNFQLGVDYFLGDLVQIKNDYGISAVTRIIEIIDSEDDQGHDVIVTLSVFAENSEQDTNEYILAETNDILMTENDIGLVTEDNAGASLRSVSSSPSSGNGLRISELDELSVLNNNHYIPFAESGVKTRKVKFQVLANSFAAASHTHAAGDINSGTFSSDRLPTVPISKGGTGATNAGNARANLAVAYSPTDANGSITKAGNTSGQVFFIICNAGPASSKAGDRMILCPTDSGIFLWDSTTSETMWTVNIVNLLSRLSTLETKIKDPIRREDAAVVNFTVPANGTATAQNTFTIPSGFAFGGLIEAWFDYTGTTNGTGMQNVIMYNHWTSGNTAYVAVKNLGSTAAKVTVHIQLLYYRNS